MEKGSFLRLSAFLLMAVAVRPTSAQELPVLLISGNRVVIRGTIAGSRELTMLVDTGAKCTVIDPRMAQRLKLIFLPRTVEYVAFGKQARAPLAVVRDLRVGPITTSLACVVGAIPIGGVDMILGLNVLAKHNFEIDFQQRKMIFDPPESLPEPVPFEPGIMLPVIKVRVHSQVIRMLVDTGAAISCAFREGPALWLNLNEHLRTSALVHMGGRSQYRDVSLKTLGIGSKEWRNLKAMVISNPKPASWDAVLGIGSLGLRRIHFDFQQRFLGLTR